MKGKRLLINTVFLTITSLLLRSLGLVFQVYLSRAMGTAGIGLFGLIMSVNSFAATVAISGIRFATTRLVSEELGKGEYGCVSSVVKRCLLYAAGFGLLAAVLLYFIAEPVGVYVISDIRTVLPLKILSVSMPFLSCGAVIGGYFTGSCRVGRPAIASITEQATMMAVSVLLVSSVDTSDAEIVCCAVALGGVSGEVLSFIVAMLLYIFDRRKKQGISADSRNITGRMFKIALPLAVSAYARTALNTLQNVLVPDGLRKSGSTSNEALSQYGIVQGMALPVVTFPQVLFASLSELIVPELTEEQVRGRGDRIASSANILLKLCYLFSAGVMGVFVCFADDLGNVLYSSEEVGIFIRTLAFLMPIMYMDSVTDGLLRGLGQQLYSMRVNIVDSLLSTVLIYTLLPKFAVYGYIFVLFASEIFNFILSMKKLTEVTEIHLDSSDFLLPIIAAGGADNFTRLLINVLSVPTGTFFLICEAVVFTVIYAALLRLLSAVNMRELRGMMTALK